MIRESVFTGLYYDDLGYNGQQDTNVSSLISAALNFLHGNISIRSFVSSNIPAATSDLPFGLVITSEHIAFRKVDGSTIDLTDSHARTLVGTESVSTPSFGSERFGSGQSYISIPSGGGDNGINGLSVDKYTAGLLGYPVTFTMTLPRIILHEFSHIALRKHNQFAQISDEGTPSDRIDDVHVGYSEDLAVMAENFLYVPYAISTGQNDAFYRMGHSRGFTAGGVSGIEAFDSFGFNRTIDPSNTRYIEFKGQSQNGSSALSLQYYDVDSFGNHAEVDGSTRGSHRVVPIKDRGSFETDGGHAEVLTRRMRGSKG